MSRLFSGSPIMQKRAAFAPLLHSGEGIQAQIAFRLFAVAIEAVLDEDRRDWLTKAGLCAPFSFDCPLFRRDSVSEPFLLLASLRSGFFDRLPAGGDQFADDDNVRIVVGRSPRP